MKSVLELNLGSNDAEDYRRKENKDFFNQIFIKDNKLDQLLLPNYYFLIGEKGTGKTAYSVFLANNNYKETKSLLKYIRETEYHRFVEMKRNRHLQLSDYTNIWSVILLVLLANEIEVKELKQIPFSKTERITAIRDAVDEFYSSAFSPEISNALNIVENSGEVAEIILKNLVKIGGKDERFVSFSEEKFQINLQYLEKKLKESLEILKLKKNHLLFIDGIDFRPGDVPYAEYLECIKGLANATWQLNNDFFANIKDSKGRFKIVLLLRPDIFNSIGFQNSTNKLMNNTVYLDWRTDYPSFMKSDLMKVGGTLLRTQQESNHTNQELFTHYFNWRSESTLSKREYDPAYIDILKNTFSRPRDLVTIMLLMQKTMKNDGMDLDYFPRKVFFSNSFKNAYSEYLLGIIKDQLSFYYSNEEWELFLQFFPFLKGSTVFDYKEYKIVYEKFIDLVLDKSKDREGLPKFIDTPEEFLQFLYDSNIICYIESNGYYRWCYRERNSVNVNPKVGINSKYVVHIGLHKSLNLGNKW